jgi:peptidoglycan-associated lipoprotein
MKKPALAIALILALPFLACHHGPKPGPPALPTPPPAAPATPPPAPTPVETTPPIENEYDRLKNMAADQIDRLGLLQDVHFELDSSELRDADRQVLNENAAKLKQFDFLKVKVEGHCDERGSVEYNLALGQRRSKAAFDYLVSLGVAADRLSSVSFGKEVPMCQESNEDCWARNRRAHFAVIGKVTR